MDTLTGQNCYELSTEDVCHLFNTNSETGLDILEVEARKSVYGRNVIPAQAGQSPLVRFFLQFHQPLVYILLAATAITAILREWVDSGVILAVVVVNAIIGYLQESKAAKSLEALAKTTTTESRILRGGKTRNVPSEELVPGDVVLLQSGDKVPADLRLVQCRDLQIDESALTGESVPVEKDTKTLEPGTPLGDRCNSAFSSTLVTYGQGRGVVVATGLDTEIGSISKLISTADYLQTPLTRKIAAFSHILLIGVLALAALTFVIGLVRGETVFDMFMAAVALAVGAIPEGLPAVVTITLSIGVARMARRRAIIRRLPAVETLGSTRTICSDKTGTLTVNQMTVRGIWAGGVGYDVSGTGYATEGEITAASDASLAVSENVAAKECLLCGLLCNDSNLVEENGQFFVHGDPTEGALIASAGKAGFSADETTAGCPRIDTIPFESQHQYMATLHDVGDGQRKLYVKGAVEVILNKSQDLLGSDGQRASLDAGVVEHEFGQLADKGYRALAFACAEVPADADHVTHDDLTGLTFLGLQGMIDPPRPEAIDAVRCCQEAGIDVRMITGDHALTARSIAAQIGLDQQARQAGALPEVLTSREMESLSDEQLVDAVDRYAVYARVTPEQKLRLVRAFQADDVVVAMTGDGVNDAPALKQADIGVAMGITGTEVAKEASDMILTDDNFATIEAAVEEGRGVFDNLMKFIVWTLPTNLAEGLVILAGVCTDSPLPIEPVQILWINMTTAILLGMMLAFEPKERDIMLRPPRDPRASFFSGTLIGRILMVGFLMLIATFGWFEWALWSGLTENEARSIAVGMLVTAEICYLFNCRSLTKSPLAVGFFSNPWLLGGVAGMILLQLAFTYAPFMNEIFDTAPIGWGAWLRILISGIAVFSVVAAEKYVRRMRQASAP